jgi:hypothetical protein
MQTVTVRIEHEEPRTNALNGWEQTGRKRPKRTGHFLVDRFGGYSFFMIDRFISDQRMRQQMTP